ncbi:MAG TPA: hypothetical protein VLV17_05060 [Anaeromyxobacteraceae bacterium]|nr:hypothetical protein [Anaeromyxobacteraceae bacterium]
MARNGHRWKFYRVGGLDQVSLETADDLRNLGNLDQKLWVALSCPTKNLEIDSRTLELLDTDKDGRVRAPDVVAAVKWCEARLKDLAEIVQGGAELRLSSLNDATPEGRALIGAARHVLESLGKPSAEVVTPADVADTTHVFDKTDFNGDGVVPPESASDAATSEVIRDAIACAGSEMDRSGRPGIDAKRLDAFFAELADYRAWWQKGQSAEVQALGTGTAAAYQAVEAVRGKVDDFFTRVKLAAFDPRGAFLLNRSDAELTALAAKDLSQSKAELAALPVARVEAGGALPLDRGVNPAWDAEVAGLATHAVAPWIGPDQATLTAEAWDALKAKLGPYAAWQAEKKGGSVEKLGIARVENLLAGRGKELVAALILKDKALEPEALAIGDVVRMVHYHRDLYTLLKNFVSFADFYDRRKRAIFQAGTLYLDARSCDLCVRVDDPAAHAVLGSLSRMFIAYCDCRRPSGETMKVAACFTQGDSDFLMVGRNGIFYDRRGRDWDATIVRIVDNPISIRQAFLAPYKKFVRAIEEQVAKFAAAREKESETRLAAVAAGTVDNVTLAKPVKPEPVDVGKMVGIIAALGVGVGAIGAVFGGLVSGFLGLEPWWAKVVAVFGAMMAISGPSMLIAWLKLRQRTLGPVLDANGWAVNGRVKVNIPLGTTLTHRAMLPPGSTRSLEDPYDDKRARLRRRLFWVFVVVVAALLVLARHYHVWPFRPL